MSIDTSNITNDIAAYEQSLQDKQSAQEAYKKELETMLSGNNPEMILLSFLYLLGGGGCDKLNSALAPQGESLQTQADLGQAVSSLQATMHPSSTDPNSKDPQTLVNFTQSLDKILDLLNPNATSPDAKELQQALGPATSQGLYGQLLGVRQLIHWSGETNPIYNPQPDAEGKTHPSFDPDASSTSGVYTNFADYIADLSKPDKPNAGNILTETTNAFQASNTTLGSSTSQTNTNVTVLTNALKAVETFVSAIAQLERSVENVATQNYARG